ncbi:hypothetical protein OsJ_13693 [Oryza sativa Japonica Group]|uniref:DUF4220 domain-containing protein n=1 Tax=Oryza sativa subsp. japonica TaxID=39947 RepID=A3AQN7_ORYSJ|nr:hypothetical protein OsJ_13693 [Oryza sativa Japonica Group]
MPGWMVRTVFLLNSWVIRALVVFSFAAHVTIIFLAGVRRRRAIGLPITILWAANQLGRWAATYALSKLALGSTTQELELELVTLWGAFLLLHAAGPDNITAYSLEDNVLSTRQNVEMILQVSGAVFAMYKNIVLRSGLGTMIWVSSFMFIMGIFKYWERAKAMLLANLENLRSSIKKKEEEETRRRRSLRNIWRPSSSKHDNDEEALLVAHGLLDITKGAFVVSSVDEHQIPVYAARRREIFPKSGWGMMYKVVDMELSLMYDILYTKAAMVHTWHGYAMRAASPFATSVAFMLFWFDSKQGQRMTDVLITYFLLGGTVLLDIIWLLRAVASTRTYSFLNDRPHLWVHHAFLCSGKWRLLRRLIVSLDPSLILAKEPSSYRKWSGKIGQYNLLHKYTHDKDERTRDYLSYVVEKVASEDISMEYEYHNLRGIHISVDFKKNLLDCIWDYMYLAYPVEDVEEKKKEKEEKKKKKKKGTAEKKPDPPMKPAEHHNIENIRKLEEALDFLPEFQESILIMHITTNVVFMYTESEQNAESSKSKDNVELRSLYEATEDALAKIWSKKESSRCSSRSRQKCLADILRCMENKRREKRPDKSDNWRLGYRTRNWQPDYTTDLYSISIVLSDGIKLADHLLQWLHRNYWVKFPKSEYSYEAKFAQMFPKLRKILNGRSMYDYPDKWSRLLEHIFLEWVRLLINASVKCTRDSHAKQLSRGGELTTVVWILVEHAGVFRVDRQKR